MQAYISKYLHQAVAVPKQKKKQVRITAARVLTSEEAIKIMQDKEDEKKEGFTKSETKGRKGEEKSKKMAATKKDTGLKKMPTQKASIKLTNEKTRKGKGKATVKDKRFGYLSHMYAIVSEGRLCDGRLDRMPLQTVDSR